MNTINTPMTRALISFNGLAMFLAAAVALQYMILSAGHLPWWEFLLTLGFATFLFALPFAFFYVWISEGRGSGAFMFFTAIFNLLFCVAGVYVLFDHEPTFDGQELFAAGCWPIALANAAYVIFAQD